MNYRLTGAAVFVVLLACSESVHAAEVDFVRDVVPALTKSGCNAGACHGSFQGRGGFRLSLLGFDPAADYTALVEEARGRRVSPSSPEMSLLLRKATAVMPHGGGQRLTPQSPAYEIVRDWIQQGVTRPDGALRLQGLTVEPAELVLQSAGQEAQLKLTAVWSDGVVRDVTSWAHFDLREQDIATVTPTGLVKSVAPGRVAVTIRYGELVRATPVSIPFGPQQPVEFARQNYIDELLAAEWQKLGLKPGPVAGDEELVRRVYLDVIGTLPTVDEARRFIADPSADKRARLVDALLERSEYVDYWALKWSDLLRAHRRALGEKGLASFHSWLKQRLRENAGFDVIARDLITSEGNLFSRGPVAYYFIDKTPEELAETTAQVFLGVRLACARCHHHPFEVWGQDDYYSLASFFTGVVRKDNRENGAYGGAQAIRAQPGEAMKHPLSGAALPPRALGWTPPQDEAVADVRKHLANWLTQADNQRFAKAVVNRYWAALFGRGLVHPVDDLSTSNPPVFPAALEALAKDFSAHKFDLKHVLRTICNSRAYQLAAQPHPTIDREGKFFVQRIPFRLPAEVLLDAISQATGSPEAFTGLPEGTRAISLPDSNVDSYFLTTFGRPRRSSSCDCERMNKLDLAQVLHLANGEKLQAKLNAAGGRVARLVKEGKSDGEIVDELYLATLTRAPTEEERKAATEFLAGAGAPARQEALEDVLWALVNCAEFVMNH